MEFCHELTYAVTICSKCIFIVSVAMTTKMTLNQTTKLYIFWDTYIYIYIYPKLVFHTTNFSQ